MGFLDDLAELASATVIASKGTADGRGDFTVDSTLDLTLCHIEGENRRVVNFGGTVVVSTYQIFSLENNNLWAGRDSNNEEWRFTLPVADHPNTPTLLVPANIVPYRDEVGRLCEEIQL